MTSLPRRKLTVVGCTVIDVLFTDVPRLPTWPSHAEFTSANLVLLDRAPIVTLGGNGANAAYIAGQQGATVHLYSSMGDDEFGRMAARWLKAAGCAVTGRSRRTATAVNVTAADARHRRATYFYAATAPRLPRLNARAGDAVLVCGWPHPPLDQVAREFKRLRAAGVLTALDLGPILGEPWPWTTLEKVLVHTGLLLGNRHEFCTLTGESQLSGAHARMRRVCPGLIVAKLGPAGAAWSSPQHSRPSRVGAGQVRVVNTVGAGDSFNGAFLAALLREVSVPRAVKLAVACATRIVGSGHGVLGLSAVRPRRV
ncbi:MAG: carbohydrate kinase family protein [Burkholderiales bacterium]